VNNLVLPLIGFALTVWLWTSLSGRTFVVGLIWLALGVVLLAVVTRGFRRPVPMLDLREEASVDDETEAAHSATASAVPTGERAQG
jgi:putrescine importer